MQCIAPLRLRIKGTFQDVPCGRCNFCLSSKRTDWSIRLQHELQKSVYANFFTLTYSPDHLPIDPVSGLPSLCKRDLQLFKKRLRKEQALHSRDQVRYYSVGEYGTRGDRPHYHSIIFNVHPKVNERLNDIWGLGQTLSVPCNIATIHYVTKYVINRSSSGELCPVMRLLKTREPPKALMSRNPGIGSSYVDTMMPWHRVDMKNYTRFNGVQSRLPRYWKEKIFTLLERQSLAVQSQQLMDENYLKEVQRLSEFEENPESYIEAAARFAHDRVTVKLNSKDTL